MISSEQFVAAFEALADGLYRVSVSLLRHQADAQDAVQEAFLKAWQARAGCRIETIRPWLTRITINECRNIQRKRRPDVPIDSLAALPGEERPPERELLEAIQSLPESLRLPLLLRYMEGYPDKDSARALGISAIAVRNRIWRARRLLKDMLTRQEDRAHE